MEGNMTYIDYFNIRRLINILINSNIVIFCLVIFPAIFYLRTYSNTDLFIFIPIIALTVFTTARLMTLPPTIYLFSFSNDKLKDYKLSLTKYSISTITSLLLLLEVNFKYSSYF